MISPRNVLKFAVHSLPRFILVSVLSMLISQILVAQVPEKPIARLLDTNLTITNSRPRLVGSPLVRETEANPPASVPSLSDASNVERNAFDQTNRARVLKGLPALAWDSDLCRLARSHSEDMARNGYFAHETPAGLQLKDRARAMGILHFKVIGENIAYNKGYENPGAFAVERWMNSGGHRANMLYAGFQASAIGSYVSSDGSVYLTQVFITR